MEIPISIFSHLTPSTPERLVEWEWQNTILPHLKASRLPERYCRKVSLTPRQRGVSGQVKALCCGTGAIVALVGVRGVGKTEITAQIIIERALDESLLPWHRRPPYRKLTDLLAKFKPAYSDFGSINIEEVMRRRNSFCEDHPLVVIDELHDCEEQKLKDRLLTDILDRRYAALNDTILISNQTVADVMASTNASTLSRLEEHGQIIECKWNSFRRKETAKAA